MLFASVLPFTWRVWAAAAGLATIGLAACRLIFGLFPHFFIALQSNTAAQRWRRARQAADAFVRLPPGAQPRLPAAFLLIAALLGGWRFAATYPNLNP
ncbi:MAG TPA: hypothetical protein VLS48_04125, partial [Anaerolineales bacterium]|nr:hypothetical protein [Anaerolineales bacterium]